MLVISRNLDIDFNEMKRVFSSGVFLEKEEEETSSDCIHKYIVYSVISVIKANFLIWNVISLQQMKGMN